MLPPGAGHYRAVRRTAGGTRRRTVPAPPWAGGPRGPCAKSLVRRALCAGFVAYKGAIRALLAWSTAARASPARACHRGEDPEGCSCTACRRHAGRHRGPVACLPGHRAAPARGPAAAGRWRAAALVRGRGPCAARGLGRAGPPAVRAAQAPAGPPGQRRRLGHRPARPEPGRLHRHALRRRLLRQRPRRPHPPAPAARAQRCRGRGRQHGLPGQPAADHAPCGRPPPRARGAGPAPARAGRCTRVPRRRRAHAAGLRHGLPRAGPGPARRRPGHRARTRCRRPTAARGAARGAGTWRRPHRSRRAGAGPARRLRRGSCGRS